MFPDFVFQYPYVPLLHLPIASIWIPPKIALFALTIVSRGLTDIPSVKMTNIFEAPFLPCPLRISVACLIPNAVFVTPPGCRKNVARAAIIVLGLNGVIPTESPMLPLNTAIPTLIASSITLSLLMISDTADVSVEKSFVLILVEPSRRKNTSFCVRQSVSEDRI